jgi:antitoxin component YwqK of YwqJK toxin-antitoxin module
MKTMQYPVLSIIALVFSAWFSGCGKDPENGSTTPKNGNEISPIIPEAKIKLPGSKWVGSRAEFEVIFEERDSPSNGNLDYQRLFVRANDSPYTGSITRIHLNGRPEFTGNYENGYLQGPARQWNSDGSLDSSTRVEGGIALNLQTPEELSGNELEVSIQPKLNQVDVVVPSEPIFIGDNDNLAEWTTITVEDEVQYLLDKRTGQKVTGGLKVYDKNGVVSYYSEYKDGKLHGRNENWHNNGVKSTDANYINGVKHGLETWRDEESGLKTWEANYVNGKQHGLETTWDENGTILFQRSYQNGQLISPNQ